MEFQFINIYSKEIAQAIIDFVTENKLVTKRNQKAYWNKEGKLKYFLKNKYKANYNFEDEPDLTSSGETYTIIVFDDIIEIRSLAMCYEDETDLEDIEGFYIDDVNSVLKELSNVMEIIFNKTIKFNKYKNNIEKIYYENYQQSIHADDGYIGEWDKSFNDFNIKFDYNNYGVFNSEDFNEFQYILEPELLSENTEEIIIDRDIKKLQEIFIENIIKTGDIEKIMIVKPEEVPEVQNKSNDEKVSDDDEFHFISFADEANKLSNQMSDIIDRILDNDEVENLTQKQEEILNYIIKEYKENNEVPSIRTMCKDLELKSPATVSEHIKNLKNKGYIMKNDKNKIIPLRDIDGNIIS